MSAQLQSPRTRGFMERRALAPPAHVLHTPKGYQDKEERSNSVRPARKTYCISTLPPTLVPGQVFLKVRNGTPHIHPQNTKSVPRSTKQIADNPQPRVTEEASTS